MSRKTILVSAPLGLGALVLLWAALAARGEHETKPVPGKPIVKTVKPTATAEGMAFADAPARPAAPKTAAPAASDGEFSVIEERIRLMEQKLLALEAKRAELTSSNQDLERQITDKQTEASSRMLGEWRVRQWEQLLGLTETQKQSLIELCTRWAKEDGGRPAARETWLQREDDLRARLSVEQAGRLNESAAKQSQLQWNNLGRSLGSMIGANKDEILRYQQTLGDWRPDGGMLLPEGHGADWTGLMKEGTNRLQSVLTPDQLSKLKSFQR